MRIACAAFWPLLTSWIAGLIGLACLPGGEIARSDRREIIGVVGMHDDRVRQRILALKLRYSLADLALADILAQPLQSLIGGTKSVFFTWWTLLILFSAACACFFVASGYM